ncbi:Metallo-dependent hydrolase [Ceraceosorus guamensis]|uniref:Metallo-dependent hydrolase n=1 Tax=Ceraceosorus guamensis TaxID=1522189 RepID=A0A316W0R8_9BASI|nr:Metallo-dependent hydrolase [Ceraceosorus guamensis]PWN42141.1 Metallo-dependent hydrolase [Ceraceosorus guamensis]
MAHSGPRPVPANAGASSGSYREAVPEYAPSPSLRPALPAPSHLPKRVFVGSIVTPVNLTHLRLIERGILGVGTGGVIRFVEDLAEVELKLAQEEARQSAFVAEEEARGRSQHRQSRDQFKSHAGTDEDSSGHSDDESHEEGGTTPGAPARSMTPKPLPVLSNGKTQTSQLPTTSTRDVSAGGLQNGSKREVSLPPPALPTDMPLDWTTQTAAAREASASRSRSVGIGLPPSQQQALERKAILYVVKSHGWNIADCEVVRLDPGAFLQPGFIDTHTHACQVPNLGLGQQYELLDWLQHVTFPREARFEDPVYARKTYDSVVQRLLDSGTTCAAIFATIHQEATSILAEICNDRGMRALVGKCAMDRNAPINYIEKNASVSLEATKTFIKHVRSLRPHGEYPDALSPTMTPTHTSGSPEMDASIARLSATMSEIMSSGDAKERPKSCDRHNDALQLSTGTSPPESHVDSGRSENKRLSQSAILDKQLPSSGWASHRVERTNRASAPSSAALTRNHSSSRSSHKPKISAPLVQPILTPRFAISCSDSMLASIAALWSRDPSLRIQTHLSENEGEIAFTKKLFPFAENYTSVYEHFSLLTPRTILAHAIHLESSEMDLIRKRDCGISHCPNSNFNLRSGTSRIGEMLNRGITKIGLGTDASGGFGLGILSAIREASVVAKVLSFPQRGKQEGELLTAQGLGDCAPVGLLLRKAKEQTKESEEPRTSREHQTPPEDGRHPMPPVDHQHKVKRPAITQKGPATPSGAATTPRKTSVSTTGSSTSSHASDSASTSGTSAAEEESQLGSDEGKSTKATLPEAQDGTPTDFCAGPLSIATLFYLATLGGAHVCSLADTIGSLDVGKEFDALLIRTTSNWDPIKGYRGCPNLFIEEEDTIETRLEKFLFCGDDRNISSVFVRGRCVGGADPIS